jgi:hypothetical protein
MTPCCRCACCAPSLETQARGEAAGSTAQSNSTSAAAEM